jgi:hypothetical protein
MDKFLMMVLLLVFHMRLMALQLDEERAMHLLFELKHAVNRAVHAAAQQTDAALLAQGVRAIDEARAEEWFLDYLRANLRLDEHLAPLPGSPLREPVDVVVFDVINADETFPYHYRNAEHGLDVVLYGPGVVAAIRAEYPRIYRFISPIGWTVKGAAELVPGG